MIKMTFFIFLCGFVLSSCVTLSKEQCQNFDWYKLGLESGSHGRDTREYSLKESQCAKHGIAPNPKQFTDGRTEGLKAFCTYENGIYQGTRGNVYMNVCPNNSNAEFLKGYNPAWREYELKKREQRVAERESELNRKESLSLSQCNFNSDCTVQRSCIFNKCQGSQSSCSFNSDCKVQGQCIFNKCEY